MAANIIRIQNHKNGSVNETVVFQPNINIIYTEVGSDILDLVVGITQYPVLTLSFPSRALLDTFVTDLTSAVGPVESGEVILSNANPLVMISTTTTTTGLTTTTTTIAGTTTTSQPATTTSTSTTLAPYSYNYSSASYSNSGGACAIDSLTNIAYASVGIANLNDSILYADDTLTTPIIGDGNYYTIAANPSLTVKHAIQIAANGLISNNTPC